MWHWEQGRMAYFQFDVIRQVARYSIDNDLRNTPKDQIRSETGLEFRPLRYEPWRNYARALKLCMIATDQQGSAVPTAVAEILANPGAVTCDEYLHFLAQVFTDPSPAQTACDWIHDGRIRHPLCFVLKYILAKIASENERRSSIYEIINAYVRSDFDGSESQIDFVRLIRSGIATGEMGFDTEHPQVRRARESIKFLCQISYLHNSGNDIVASLHVEDATVIFNEMEPINGPRRADGDEEIRRLASLFRDGTTHDFFDYPASTASAELESGFAEGNRVKRSHVVIERNSQLRRMFFRRNPTSVCDCCLLDTHRQYPWSDRTLDVHHLLPLSSGTRVEVNRGTLLSDLVPICPSCHRAIHRFYERYLTCRHKVDFNDVDEAFTAYNLAKTRIKERSPHAVQPA